MTDADRVAALEALYSELPSLECRGLCWHSCGPVDMSITERERIADLGRLTICSPLISFAGRKAT